MSYFALRSFPLFLVDALCPECAEHFGQVRRILDSAGLSYRLNDRLVRGLDYYQRTTFEVVSGEIGAQTAVAGGGRYDGLIRQLGGPDLPGIGFACGMERLALLCGEIRVSDPDFYMAVLDDQALNTALLLAQRLRERGFSGKVSFDVRSVKSQAEDLYRKATKQRNVNAQFNLGRMYEAGEGVERDTEEAVKWYRKAAEQEGVDAQARLDDMDSDDKRLGRNHENSETPTME